MRRLSLLCFCVYIASFLSPVSAFSFTFGIPTQCDPFSVSWTGGQAPFVIVLAPIDEPPSWISIPSSAFSNGTGLYLIPQLPLANGTQFLLTMFDSTGSGSSATTTILSVGSPIANNNCNTMGTQDFYFSTSGIIQQCSGYTFTIAGDAFLPLRIVGLIPGGNSVNIYPVTTTSYTWVADVQGGTDILFFMVDSRTGGGPSGVSYYYTVQPSSNTSCLSANSPSTTSSPSPSPQSQSSSSTSNVGIIAGAVGGVAIFFISLIILGIYCKRKPFRRSDALSSPKRKPYQPKSKDRDWEAGRSSASFASSAVSLGYPPLFLHEIALVPFTNTNQPGSLITANPSAQIIRKPDTADHLAVGDQEVVELPPGYTERPFLTTEAVQEVAAESASDPNH